MRTSGWILVGSLVATCAVAVAACGGGGGGGGPPAGPEAALSGSYVYVLLDRDVSGNAMIAENATFTADGAGGIVFQNGWRNAGGGPDVGVRRSNASYTVDADRMLDIAGGFASVLTGKVSSGGSYAAATALGAGADPGWLCAVRRDTTPSLAELAGTWRLVDWQRHGVDPDDAHSLLARVTVDASGRISHSDIHYNLNGAIDPGAIVFTATTFSIGGPGGVEVAPGGIPVWQGGLSENGRVILLASRSDILTGVRVFVREDSASGDASVQGSWVGACFQATRPGYACLRAGVELDGAGDGTWASRANLDGSPGIGTLTAVEYTIGVDGQAALLWPLSAAAHGAAASSFLLLGGPLTPGRGPTVYVLIR